MEIEKAKSLDIARLLAFRGLMSGNKGLCFGKRLLAYKGQKSLACEHKKKQENKVKS